MRRIIPTIFYISTYTPNVNTECKIQVTCHIEISMTITQIHSPSLWEIYFVPSVHLDSNFKGNRFSLPDCSYYMTIGWLPILFGYTSDLWCSDILFCERKEVEEGGKGRKERGKKEKGKAGEKVGGRKEEKKDNEKFFYLL